MKTILAKGLLLFLLTAGLSNKGQAQDSTSAIQSDVLVALPDAFQVKATSFEEYKGFGSGSGYTTAKKGYKFVGIIVDIQNTSNERQDLNMEDVFLADTVQFIKYKVFSVQANEPFTIYQRSKRSVKAKDSLSRRLVYLVPQDLKAYNLLYNGKLIPVQG